LVAVLLIVGVAVTALVFNIATPAKQEIERDKRTASALVKAKEALIGYAASDNNRPGSLPCPDADNNGNAEPFDGSECPDYVAGSNVYVGRLPWRTLGLADTRDGNGERLWYAVSRTFARNPSCGAACPLNSDTAGQLTVNGTPSYTDAIAIVFASGPVLGAQVRDFPNENAIANYLEGENANGDSVFAIANATTTFNDRLLVVTREALYPVVELRVAREIRLILRSYYQTNRYYPAAAQFPNNTSTDGTYRGYIPRTTCAPVVAPTWPQWLTDNNWHQVMVYAVAPRCTPKINTALLSIGTQPACALSCTGPILGLYTCIMPDTIDTSVLDCSNTAAGPYLTVSGIGSSIESVVLPASYRLGAQPARPCSTISECLETVSGNNENIDATDNYAYVKPVRSSSNNDNLVIVGP
jgi:type II secretory pathway pseudopilin PulG